MIIKEAFLQEEIDVVRDFLKSFDLKLDDDLTKILYVEDDDNKIIGTISCANYIIKGLAVDPTYQSENLAGVLVNEMIQYFRNNNIFNYQVFTKPMYKDIFISMGFRKIVETKKVIMLEGGVSNISLELDKLKIQLKYQFGPITEETDIAALVINGNPLTNGHVYLIEEASKRHNYVVVFIVEENKSEFSFEERFSMAYLATKRFGNVCVLPSTKYVVSALTFPSYFLKDADEVNEEYAKIDALIFKEHFMKQLFIKKRYVGTEKSNKMNCYNDTLKEILKDDLEIVERISENGDVISASRVRALLKENKLNEALDYIPRENHIIFRMIVRQKYGC